MTETLADYKGRIHCDADPVFNGIGSQEGVTLSYCQAHARRKFEGVEKANRKQAKSKRCLAKVAMRYYRELYAIERQAKDNTLSPEDRCRFRKEHSEPLLNRFYAWLVENQAKTLPKSPIGKAFSYTLKYWKGLCLLRRWPSRDR